MDLDRLGIHLRARSDYEAADLGFAMMRTWCAAIYRPWLAVAGSAALLLVGPFGFFGLLAFWWLLPLWEMIALEVISRATFGETLSTRSVIRSAPRIWRQGFAEALWRRIHPARSFRMPVCQLENAAGSVRRQRIKALESRASDVPSWLTAGFFCFHLGLLFAVTVFIEWVTPTWSGIDWQLAEHLFWEGEAAVIYHLLSLLAAIIILLFDPFYVACGFAVYLNRRVELEGWDLDLAFRRLDRRLEALGLPLSPAQDADPQSADSNDSAEDTGDGEAQSESVSRVDDHPTPTAAGLLFVALLAGLSWLGPQQASAAPVEKTHENHFEDSRAKAAMAEVMAMEELQTEIEEERWGLRDDIDWSGWSWLFGSGSDTPRGFAWSGLSGLAEILLWLTAGLVVLWLLREGLRASPGPAAVEATPTLPVETVLGLDIRRESLPDDVVAAAEQLWLQGEHKESLRLLYRASLSHLQSQGMELRESFTENDCLVHAERLPGAERLSFFAVLTRAWQAGAYAHRFPSSDQARELWQQWQEHFAAAEGIES